MLGYNLKREFLGDSINYRNVEEYSYEIAVTDFSNFDVDLATGKNYLSDYIKTEISNYFNTNKTDITLKSLELPVSSEAVEDLIRFGSIKATFEIRKPISAITLDIQHPELDPTTSGGGAEGGRFHGVRSVILTYAKEIDSLSETFDFSDEQDGSHTLSHSIELTLKSSVTSSAKNIAQTISSILFSNDVNNTAFGENVFLQALFKYGGSSMKHYHTESYDLKQNKFSFSKKAKILKKDETINLSRFSKDEKYAIDFSSDGGVNITETVSLSAITGSFSDITGEVLTSTKNASYGNCSSVLSGYLPGIIGLGTSSQNSTLQPEPVSVAVSLDKRGLKITVTTVFSNDPQIMGHKIEETISLDKNERGIASADYSLTLNIFAQKQLNGDVGRKYGTGSKSSIEILKTYDDDAINKIILASSPDPDVTHNNWVKPFRNTIPSIFSNDKFNNAPASAPDRSFFSSPSYSFASTSKTVTSSNMGKTYSLQKKFSNDPIYTQAKTRSECPNCYTKFEIKTEDTLPKENINEYVIINRGSVDTPFGKTVPNTSVTSSSYTNQPGKRSVNITASLTRPANNRLTDPTIPYNPLKDMAKELKKQLSSVLLEKKISDTMQSVGYLSSLRYSFDSAGNVTMGGDLEYTYKKPAPRGA